MRYIVRNISTGAAGVVETDKVYGWQHVGPNAKEVYCSGSWCQVLGEDTTSFFTERLGDLITEEINDFQGDLDLDEEISSEANDAIAEAIEQLKAAIAMAKCSTIREEAPGMKYYPSKTWMGYEVVREAADGRKEYLMSVRKGVYKWATDYTYAAKYSLDTAMRHIKEVQQ